MLKVHKELKPHTTNLSTLKKASKIYAQDKTPEVHADGRVRELDVKPGGPELAANHLREIHKSFGDQGVQQAVMGLQVTRGNQFVLQMMESGNDIKELIAGAQKNETSEAIPASVKNVLNSNNSGNSLPPDMRSLVHQKTGDDPTDVRIYDNPDSHTAADSIGAKAFTVGQRIFFGKGQYNPHTNQGRELLAHEIAHTYQQGMAPNPSVDALTISSPKDRHEHQADQFAKSIAKSNQDSAANDGEFRDDDVAAVELSKRSSFSVARIQRVISFTAEAGTVTPNNMDKDENAAGFRFQSAGGPIFQWEPDVTIHGDAGDNFADWEVAHHQVAKGFWRNIYWGHGANQTRRRYFIDGGVPMRDATAAGNTWYSDFRAQGFAADGDTRSPVLSDNPGSARHPWDNPMPGRVGNRGTFNYGFGFVSTLSARHIPDGTGADAFRHLSHMHWNFGIAGTFDASQPMGSRVNITTGGPINHAGPFPGFDPANRPMHGGDIVNDNFDHNDT